MGTFYAFSFFGTFSSDFYWYFLLFFIIIIVHADHLAQRAVVEAVVAVVLLLLNVETGDEGLLNKNQTSCGDLPVGHSVPSNSYSFVIHTITGTFISVNIIIFPDNREILCSYAVYGKPSPTRFVLDCNRAGEGWKAWLVVDQGWYLFGWYWRVYFLMAGLVVAIE